MWLFSSGIGGKRDEETRAGTFEIAAHIKAPEDRIVEFEKTIERK